jgi:hypothetical protein
MPPPPPVPPKNYKQSPIDEQKENNLNLKNNSPKINGEEEKEEEKIDLMKSAFEDSTIGRDHSVLPPGARSIRRHSPHTSIDGCGTSGTSSGDERPRRRVIISPMVQPQLVASGR